MNDLEPTEYDQASDEPELVLAPRTTFVSVSGAGAPATPVRHRKKVLGTASPGAWWLLWRHGFGASR